MVLEREGCCTCVDGIAQIIESEGLCNSPTKNGIPFKYSDLRLWARLGAELFIEVEGGYRACDACTNDCDSSWLSDLIVSRRAICGGKGSLTVDWYDSSTDKM